MPTLKQLYEDLLKIKDDLESKLGAMSGQLDKANDKLSQDDKSEDIDTEDEYEPINFDDIENESEADLAASAEDPELPSEDEKFEPSVKVSEPNPEANNTDTTTLNSKEMFVDDNKPEDNSGSDEYSVDNFDDEPLDLKDVPSAYENIPQYFKDAIAKAREEGKKEAMQLKNPDVPQDIVAGFHTKPGKKAYSANTGYVYWRDNGKYFRAKSPEEQPEEIVDKQLLKDVQKAIGV